MREPRSESNWPEIPLQIVASIQGGGTPPPAKENWDGTVPFVTPPDLNGLDGQLVSETARTISESAATQSSRMIGGGVIISCRAPIGHIGTVNQPSAFNQGCKGIECDETDARFIAYSLVARRDVLESLGNGTTFSELSSTSLGGLKITWPDSGTRRAIADYLDRETAEIDGMVAELDRLVELLQARSLRLLSDVYANLVNKNSTLTTIKHVLAKLDRPSEPRSGIITAFRDGEVTLRSNRREDGFTHSQENSGYQGVSEGDLIFHGLDGFAGACGVSDSSGICSPVYHVCSTTDSADSEFIARTLRSMGASGLLEAYSWSVRQRAVDYRNWATFGSLPIPLPPLDEQRRIVEKLDRETAEIDAMIADARRLKELLAERRSVLITEVVTGRKPVPVPEEVA